jgi:hypothetical protein
MKGHLRERSPGHWAIVIDVRDSQTGKRKRSWHSFAGTKRRVQVECARLLTELKAGTAVEPSRITLAAFFERWLEHMRGQVSPRSHERYAELCRKNLVPLLGHLTLAKLQPTHISQAYAKALASGRRDGDWRPFRAYGHAYAPRSARGPTAGCQLAAACTQSCRRLQAA